MGFSLKCFFFNFKANDKKNLHNYMNSSLHPHDANQNQSGEIFCYNITRKNCNAVFSKSN